MHCPQIHLDGKKRKNPSTGGQYEYISIAVSGGGLTNEKFLGDVELEVGTGEATALAVYNTIILEGGG